MREARSPGGGTYLEAFLCLRQLDPHGALSIDVYGRFCVSLVSAARIAGVPPCTIRGAIRSGRLPATRAAGLAKNRPWLVPLVAVQRFQPLRPGRPPKRMDARSSHPSLMRSIRYGW
jgi:hypothetical protein